MENKSELKNLIKECINEVFANMNKSMGYSKIAFDGDDIIIKSDKIILDDNKVKTEEKETSHKQAKDIKYVDMSTIVYEMLGVLAKHEMPLIWLDELLAMLKKEALLKTKVSKSIDQDLIIKTFNKA